MKNYRGMVIYYANPYGDPENLNSPVNLQMIHHSSQLIGAAAAFRAPCEESEAFLRANLDETWKRVRAKILVIMRFGGTIRAKKRASVAQSSTGDKKKTRRSSIQKVHEMSIKLRKDFKKTAIQAKDDFQHKSHRWWTKTHGGKAGEDAT